MFQKKKKATEQKTLTVKIPAENRQQIKTLIVELIGK